MPLGNALRGTELFGNLDGRLLHRLVTSAWPRRYRRGDAVFTEGGTGEELLVLMSGTMVLYRGAGDQRVMLGAARPPAVLGEEALAARMPRLASAEAIQESFALALPKSQLAELMRYDPAVSAAAQRWLARRLARQVEQRADDVLLDLPGRLAKILVELFDAASSAVDVSQGTLAGLAHGSRQRVNQTLKVFARRGWLRMDRGRIVVLDPEALQRRASVP